MRKIFFAMSIFASINASAQKVNVYKDTTGDFAYCNIAPVTATIGDTAACIKLSVSTFADDQISYCKIYWALRSDRGLVLADGNYELSGEDYAAWGDRNYLYNYVAGKLNLTILK